MNWNPNLLLGPKRVVTPEILDDIATYCGTKARNRFDTLDEPMQEKLIVLAERLEFVEDLTVLRRLLAERKAPTTPRVERADSSRLKVTVPEKLEWEGHDLAGVDHDLEALALYLLLTCIDTIKGQPVYVKPFTWLIDQSGELAEKEEEEIASLLADMGKTYRESYGLRRRFVEAFTQDLADFTLREEVASSFAVVSVRNGQINTASGKAWEQKSTDQRLKKIADKLYDIRSRYTHTSVRSFFPSVPVSRIPDLEGRTLLQRREARPLARILREVILHLTEQCLLVSSN